MLRSLSAPWGASTDRQGGALLLQGVRGLTLSHAILPGAQEITSLNVPSHSPQFQGTGRGKIQIRTQPGVPGKVQLPKLGCLDAGPGIQVWL